MDGLSSGGTLANQISFMLTAIDVSTVSAVIWELQSAMPTKQGKEDMTARRKSIQTERDMYKAGCWQHTCLTAFPTGKLVHTLATSLQ